MTNTNNYQVRDLILGGGKWRIDWFGAVTFAERYRRASQPLIEVQLSELPSNLTSMDELFALKNNQWPKSRQVRLPVGFLPMLKIGDIWEEGRMIDSPAYDTVEFGGVSVTRDGTALIKAGLSREDDKEFYLPVSHHPYHIHHTKSYCVRINAGETNLVVPSVELLRFYFGSSSDLVSRIFDVPFSPEKFWNNAENAGPSGRCKIDLASGLSGRSASDIGRMAFSRAACRAVGVVGNSCIAATVNGDEAYPKAIFPFDGVTDLVVSGRWLPFDGNPRGVFLVFKMLSCSYPFPFSRLDYTSDGKGSGLSGGQAGGRDTKRSHVNAGSPTPVGATVDISDQESGGTKKVREVGLHSASLPRFPDLTKKFISKRDVDDTITVVQSPAGATVVTGYSTGEGAPKNSVQPLNIVSAQSVMTASKTAMTTLPIEVRAFLELLAGISATKEYVVDMIRLHPRQRYAYLSTMPQIVDENGEIAECCLITRSAAAKYPGTTRSRRISIARVVGAQEVSYLMVPELRQKMPEGCETIELHIFVDHSGAIVSIADLQVAMATHFSVNFSQNDKSWDLGVGIKGTVIAYHLQMKFIGSKEIANMLAQQWADAKNLLNLSLLEKAALDN